MLIAKDYLRTYSSSREEHVLKFYHVNPHSSSTFVFNPQIFHANLKAIALFIELRNWALLNDLAQFLEYSLIVLIK